MSDIGSLHVLDFEGRVLASFRTQHGGSPIWMVPKLARWRADHPTAPIHDLIREILADTGLRLDIAPAGQTEGGYKRHVYHVSPLADLREDGTAPTIRVQYHCPTDPEPLSTITTIDGNQALYAAAAAELEGGAANCERIARQQEWDTKTARDLGYDPDPWRREAARFTTLAETPEADPTLALALDLTV